MPALLFLVVGAAALYIAFNALQLTSAKIKLQNTADASAYAGALLQARDYNFSAYTNRAMVANQAAVAQIISLKSFVDMLETSTRPDVGSIDVGASVSNGAGAWVDQTRQAHAMLAPVRTRLDATLPGMARSLDTIIGALSNAQLAYHDATIASVPGVASEVARENQRDTRVIDGAFDDPLSKDEFTAWRAYSTRVDPHVGSRDHFADVVTDAVTLGAFARSRPLGASEAPPLNGCYGTVNRTTWAAGGTQLRPDRRGWQAIDAATSRVRTQHDCTRYHSYQRWVWDEPPIVEPALGANTGKATGLEHTRQGHYEWDYYTTVDAGIDRDVADGRAGAGNGNVMSYQSWYGYGGYVNFGDTSGSAGYVSAAMREQYRAGPGTSLSSGGGLQSYQDLAVEGDGRPAPRITVRLARAQGTTITDPALLGGGRIALKHAPRALMAVASGQAYFARPDEKGLHAVSGLLRYATNWSRSDRATEYPSLFSPYWEARLAPPPEAMLGLVAGAKAGEGAR